MPESVSVYNVPNAMKNIIPWSFGTNIANGIFGFGQSALNYFFQKKAAEEQNKRQLEWWNMQNEYNHPKQQLKRMVEAGLNPNLMYGQISSSNAGDIGRPAVASAQFNNNVGLVEGLQTAMQLLSQAEDVRAKRIDNALKIDEYNSFPNELYDLEGNKVPVHGYYDWLQYNKTLNYNRSLLDYYSRNLLYGHNKLYYPEIRRTVGLKNEYNMRTLDDRVNLAKHTAYLRNALATGQGLRNHLQQMQNEWYTFDKVFEKVASGVNMAFDIFMPFWKNAQKLKHLINPRNPVPKTKRVTGESGGHTFTREYEYEYY